MIVGKSGPAFGPVPASADDVVIGVLTVIVMICDFVVLPGGLDRILDQVLSRS